MATVLIIGAGAAGLLPGAAVRAGHQVTVLEHMPRPGRKNSVTGKGRCNLTNACELDEFLKHVRRNPRFLYSALSACPPSFVMQLFEQQLAVPLKVERGRRCFRKATARRIVWGCSCALAEGNHSFTGAKSLLLEDGVGKGVELVNGQKLRADWSWWPQAAFPIRPQALRATVIGWQGRRGTQSFHRSRAWFLWWKTAM